MEQINLKSAVNLRSTAASTLTQVAGFESTIMQTLTQASTITPSLVLGSIIEAGEVA